MAIRPAASGRLAAFRRVAADSRMRRALLAYFTFSSVEWAVWIVVLVYARGQGNAGTVGLVAVVQLVPAALAAPGLSSLVDRLPRAAAPLIAYSVLTVALAATAAAMMAGAPFVVVVALAVVTNVVIGLCRPAHHSLTPCLASGPAELLAANVVATGSEGLGLFVGPALVGFVMAVSSPAYALAMCVVLMLGAALLTVGLAALRIRIEAEGSAIDHGTRAGLRAMAEAPTSRVPVFIGGVQGFLEGAVDVLVVLLALDVLGLGDGGAGYLNAVMGVGAIVGGVAASSLVGRRRLAPPLAVSGFLTGGAMILIAVVPPPALYLAVIGLGYSLTAVTTRTMLQRLSPMAAMGRMFGLLEGSALIGLALGALAAPLLSGRLGVRPAFAVVGVVLPVALVLLRRRLYEADASGSVPREIVRILQRVDVVSGLPPEALEALARGATTAEAAAGEVIVREGEAGHEMYVVESGSVEVDRQKRVVATLGAGDIFGEIALLGEVPRIASVTALEPTTLLVIDRAAFLSALATDDGARSAVEAIAASRRSRTMGEPT
ncbi:MAG TPA: cyclic nucleotide-binding domain-containing protein [Acidimicrobiia bacterium]|nr:cyclic nucleotide-binding domain-containing protein [Acidimicrobiia bacterium]